MSFGRLNFRVPKVTSSRVEDPQAMAESNPDNKRRAIEDSEGDIDDVGNTDNPLAKRARKSGGKHQMAACCACKKKRKKCDGKYPVCSGCSRSQIECTIFDLTTGRTIPRNYIQQLEEKVSLLSKELDLLGDYSRDQKVETSKSLQPQQSFDARKKNLETDIGYITLGAAAESYFIGQSSAFSIARAITESIHYYSKAEPTNSNISERNNFEYQYSESFSKPGFSQAKRYLDTYEASVQCQYPFLDWKLALQYFDDVQLNDSEDPKKLFFIYMIYAVGSQIYSGSSKLEYTSQSSTKNYYNKAFENINDLLKFSTLETVQVYLLLSVFSQHMPDGTSIWQTTGLAIRTAVTLGLHRKPYKSVKAYQEENCYSELEKHHLSMRSRVFWSAYSLERINGLVLGRPFGISDIDIDLPLPSNDPEIPIACHVFKLRRIQSSICTFVYKPIPLMENPEEIDSTRVSIVLELNDWMSTFPAKQHPVSRFETYNWCTISYHNSMLLLLRPVVLEVSKSKSETSPRLIEWFKVFTHSASAVCMNYKDLHGKGKLNATWLTMHCLFVAGLSFLYCLWIDNQIKVLEWKRKRVIYDTISACSSILYVLAERWNSAAVFRDTFEQVSSAVMLKLEDPNEKVVQSQNIHDLSSSAKLVKGALDYNTIGIDQYLSYESQAWRSDSERDGASSVGTSGTPEQDSSVSHHGQNSTKSQPAASFFDNFDLSLWEFLDTTGDRFLRDIYQDMENNLGSL